MQWSINRLNTWSKSARHRRNQFGEEQLAPRKGLMVQSHTGEELRPFFGRTLLPSVLDRAFKGEL
jgi:hypothetical protein